ncbi:hypothetical protein DFH06DRAFT_1214481 [Mycena polygramma]|nr:hypothetical protein DFH06DRAFT_1214481 [Mycena polygramma]
MPKPQTTSAHRNISLDSQRLTSNYSSEQWPAVASTDAPILVRFPAASSNVNRNPVDVARHRALKGPSGLRCIACNFSRFYFQLKPRIRSRPAGHKQATQLLMFVTVIFQQSNSQKASAGTRNAILCVCISCGLGRSLLINIVRTTVGPGTGICRASQVFHLFRVRRGCMDLKKKKMQPRSSLLGAATEPLRANPGQSSAFGLVIRHHHGTAIAITRIDPARTPALKY